MLTGDEYRDSLRAYRPRVFVGGRRVECVVHEPLLQPGINAIAVTYDFAQRAELAATMTAVEQSSGRVVNRLAHIDRSTDDLLAKLEAVRLVCRESGCAQRYLTHDALNALVQATARADAEHGTGYSPRALAYLHEVQERDLTL